MKHSSALPPGLLLSFTLSLLLPWSALAGTPRAAGYDGVNDGVRFPYRDGFDRNVSMTIEAWVYRANASRCETVLSQGFTTSYWFGFCGDGVRFYRSGGSSATATATVPANHWTHVAVTYDGSWARFYIDGVRVSTAALSNNGAGRTGSVYLGRDAGGTPYAFEGYLDEVRLWSVVRSEAQIRDNRFAELRSGTGLEAAWDDGGSREALSTASGIAATQLPVPIVQGVLPQELTAPAAAAIPQIDGNIDTGTEYLNAEQLVIQYGTEGNVPDARAHLVFRDDPGGGVYVGIAGAHPPTSTFPGDSIIDILIDSDNSQGSLPLGTDYRIRIYFDGTAFNVRRGGAVFPNFGWGNADPALNTHVSVAFGPGGSEFTLPNVEVKLDRDLFGGAGFSLDTDRIAIRHSQIRGGVGVGSGPREANLLGPATWAELQYGNNDASLPQVTFRGKVTDPITGAGIGGITMQFGGSYFLYGSTSTSADGTFRRTVAVAPGNQLRATMVRPGTSQTEPADYVIDSFFNLFPDSVFSDQMYFPARSNGDPIVETVDMRFSLILERPPVELGAIAPELTWPKVQVRAGTSPRFISGGVVTCEVDLANYHTLLDFFLVRTSCPNHVPLGCTENVDYFAIPEVSRVLMPSPGSPPTPYVELTIPEIPDTRYGGYRIAAHDLWSRPQNNPSGVSSWRYADTTIGVWDPPFPLTYGFQFFNRADGVNWEEFTSVYEMHAFADPLFCVPWPHYLAWFGVYAGLAGSGGSCVGMSVTSRRLEMGDYHLSAWDPDALFPNGHVTGPIVDLNADNPDGDPFFGPTPPKPSGWGFEFPCRFMPNNLWGETVRNHGKQLSQEMMESMLPQLTGAGSGAGRTFSHDGEPTRVFNRVAADPSNYVICMTPVIGSGHCVTPFRVEYGKRLWRPQPAGSPGEPGFVADPDFNLIHVYDNNFPNGITYIDIDTVHDQYWFGAGAWNDMGTEDPGDDTRKYSGRAIHAHPISLFRGPKRMISPRLDTLLHILVFGSADVLHQDTEGGTWGWDGAGMYHDDIEGAKAQALFAEAIVPSLPLHQLFLPVDKQLEPSRINVRENGDYGFYAAHRGALFRLMVDQAGAGEVDSLHLIQQGDGTLDGFRFAPAPKREVGDIVVGLVPSETESLSFTLPSPLFTGDSSFTVTVEAVREEQGFRFRLDSSNPSDQADFNVEVLTADSNAQAFGSEKVEGVSVPAGGTVGLSLPHWPAFDRILRTLDVDSDGVPEVSFLISSGDPAMDIRHENGKLTLSYPVEFSGWVLEAAGHPDGPWNPATSGIIERTSDRFSVTFTSPAGDHRVFRLHLPSI